MTKTDLQTYLHDHIPQSRAMDIGVEDIADKSLSLSAPLEPNINHRDSVFGGSASSVAILSAWAFLHCKLSALGLSPTLVIQKNSMTYDAPILGQFKAVASLRSEEAWPKFLTTLRRRGKARVEVQAKLYYNEQTVGSFIGSFVAISKP